MVSHIRDARELDAILTVYKMKRDSRCSVTSEIQVALPIMRELPVLIVLSVVLSAPGMCERLTKPLLFLDLELFILSVLGQLWKPCFQ